MNNINGDDDFFHYWGQCPNTKEWQRCLVTGADCGGCDSRLVNITHHSNLNFKKVTSSHIVCCGPKEVAA